MLTLTTSRFVAATLILTSLGLVGCNTNRAADSSATETTDQVSAERGSGRLDRQGDQGTLYSESGTAYDDGQEQAQADSYGRAETEKQQQTTTQWQRDQQESRDATGYDRQAMSRLSETVTFEFDSAELSDEAKETLRNAIQQAQGGVPMEAEVIGYTDDLGPESYNQDLSERRAQAVRTFIADLDANVEQWQVEGRGEQSADNASSREEHRKVSLTLRPMEQHAREGNL